MLVDRLNQGHVVKDPVLLLTDMHLKCLDCHQACVVRRDVEQLQSCVVLLAATALAANKKCCTWWVEHIGCREIHKIRLFCGRRSKELWYTCRKCGCWGTFL